jgi:hypothetical protein
MKIFDRDNKINFVDDNNVLLGYDMDQCCCEFADWFVTDKKVERELTGNELRDRVTGQQPSELPGFIFDTEYFAEIHASGCLDEGGMVVFRVVNGTEEKFIHLFNCHNGYYSHGFTISVAGRSIRDGSL